MGRKIILRYNNAMILLKKYVDISIPIYVKEALHQFSNKTPKNPYNQPYPAPEWTYGTYAQNTSPALPTERVN